MVREDIIAGLRNAVERGSTIEKAKQSFISAGYSRGEVEESAQFVQSVPVSTLPTEPYPEIPASRITKSIQPAKESFFKRNWKMFLLVGALFLLIILLIITILFREQITEWLY